jgi:3-dehydroquinate synthase
MSPTDDIERVRVPLGPRSYDVLIGRGLFDRAGAHIRALDHAARVAVVTDEHVAETQLPRLANSLEHVGVAHAVITVPPGEGSKSFSRLEQVLDSLLEARIERGDLVLALGGGVVGDLAGFAAAVLRRGVRFVQAPTTLLAQVDSSVGGKTGINSRHGKNLIGAFHQPALVLADLDALDTLPPREFRAGYAEVAKYGLIDDAAFFGFLEARWREVFSGGPARREAVARSCAAKARVVGEDERETGVRALLNLGHTFGHALEAATGFSARLLHGEAVAVGMRLAFSFSARLGLAAAKDAERVTAHLAAVGLPARIRDIPGAPLDSRTLMAHIAQDKKVARGRLTFILARGIGRAFAARDVDPDAVRAFLDDELGS